MLKNKINELLTAYLRKKRIYINLTKILSNFRCIEWSSLISSAKDLNIIRGLNIIRRHFMVNRHEGVELLEIRSTRHLLLIWGYLTCVWWSSVISSDKDLDIIL